MIVCYPRDLVFAVVNLHYCWERKVNLQKQLFQRNIKKKQIFFNKTLAKKRYSFGRLLLVGPSQQVLETVAVYTSIHTSLAKPKICIFSDMLPTTPSTRPRISGSSLNLHANTLSSQTIKTTLPCIIAPRCSFQHRLHKLSACFIPL